MMNGLRSLSLSWIMGSLRQVERSSFRILGAARFSSVTPPFQAETNQRFPKVHINELPAAARFFSQKSGSEAGRQGRKYWSYLAAGLLGIGGAKVVADNSDESIFIKAHCAGCCEDKKKDQCCEEKKKDQCCEEKKKDECCVEKKCETSECLRKTDREEEIIAKANAELEKALKDTKGKAVEFTEAALKAYCAAIATIKLFMDKTYCAVEEETLVSPRFEEVWCDVYETLKKRCELAKLAMEKGQCAWELLRRLREIIENGKACKFTRCNPLLVTAEETLTCAEKELCAKKKEMECILKESRVVEQYRNMVEEFRRDLKAEADSLMPNECCKVTLNENEGNMIFTHAYKKILRVQKEMNDSNKKC